MWLWCFKNHYFIPAANIPGTNNIEADKFPQKINNNTEWKLNPETFAEITNKFGYPEIDLFATRVNTHLPNCFSWPCEPKAKAVDVLQTGVSSLVIFFLYLFY